MSETEIKTYTLEEQAANRAKWVEALRSGEYEQATGQLYVSAEEADEREPYADDPRHTASGHCCLGVASDVAEREGLVLGEWADLAGTPEWVQDWLGLTSNVGVSSVFDELGGMPHSLTALNDDLGLTFNEIADLIEGGSVQVVGGEW